MSEPPIARGMRPNRHHLDEDSAARLLQGSVHPDDAPPGYGAVADLLATAASVPALDEDAGSATITAMVEAIRTSDPVSETPQRRSMIGKLLAGKALAAVAIVGLTATGAAAASGSLPDPVQGAVSEAVSHVGVNIPHPNHGKSADHRKDGKHDDSDDPAGDDNGTDEANNGQTTSTAAHDAKADAKAAGEKVGPAVCAAVTDGKCQAGQHGGGSDDEGDDQSGQHGKSADDHGKSGEDHGQSGEDHGQSGEDHGKPGADE